MDTRTLVESDIELGKRLSECLRDDSALKIGATLWWLDEDVNQWLFVISTPFYERRGAQESYLKVLKIIEKNQITIPLERVWIIDDGHPVLNAIRDVFQVNHALLSRCVVNGMLLPDVYVYVMEKRRARTKKITK